MARYTLTVNGQRKSVDVSPDTPLLWVIRENLALTGTKFGCGIQQCGACTIHLDGAPIRSCGVTMDMLRPGQRITTIEGLSPDSSHPLQKAWIEEDVPQCGYCQSGQLMAAAALLSTNKNPTDAQIDAAMTNVCRCGTYVRIRKGIRRAAKEMKP